MRRALAAFGLGMVSSWGCVVERYNTNHCAYLDGDATCVQRYGAERGFCQRAACGSTIDGDGCVEARPDDDACWSPCGGGHSLPDDPACMSAQGSSTGDESSTSGDATTTTADATTQADGESTTGPMPCTGNEDCADGATPFCEPVSGECVGCDATSEPDAACVGLDPGAPLCIEGACVECTAAAPQACMGETPVCDEATHACVPCTAHEECGEAACNLFTGGCLPSDAVVHVGPGQRFAMLGEAIDSFAAGAEGTIVVHQANFDEAVVIDGGRVLAFVAEDGALPRWILVGGGAPQLVVGDATVLMDGIQISGNSSSTHPGVQVDGGRAWLDRGRIVQNAGGGVVAQNGAELVLRNCFLGSGVDTTVVSVQSSVGEVLYATIGANFGASIGIMCNAAANVTVRNSLVVSRDAGPEVVCPGVTVSNTAAEAELGGAGNVGLGDMSTSWFQDFNAGDLHLTTPPIAVATAARWEVGDPVGDIDGDERVQIDGASDVAGADVP